MHKFPPFQGQQSVVFVVLVVNWKWMVCESARQAHRRKPRAKAITGGGEIVNWIRLLNGIHHRRGAPISKKIFTRRSSEAPKCGKSETIGGKLCSGTLSCGYVKSCWSRDTWSCEFVANTKIYYAVSILSFPCPCPCIPAGKIESLRLELNVMWNTSDVEYIWFGIHLDVMWNTSNFATLLLLLRVCWSFEGYQGYDGIWSRGWK